MNIKSLQLVFAVDGRWTTDVEMQGNFAGMQMKGDGRWSLEDGLVRYTAGANSGQSCVHLSSGRLVLEPDFGVARDGTTLVPCEYERQR